MIAPRPMRLLLILLLFSSCTPIPDQIEPKIQYFVQDRTLQSLPSAFTPLTPEERREDWARELHIGVCFGRELDLYRAASSFKRATFLLPAEATTRRYEAEYGALLAYFLGQRYAEAIAHFEAGPLRNCDTQFPAYHDLLILLYDSYLEQNRLQEARQVLHLFQQTFPQEADRLRDVSVLKRAELGTLDQLAQERPDAHYLTSLSEKYHKEKRSILQAQLRNAILPGAGYWYIGQIQTATTSFLMNGLCTAACYYFFKRGNIPAGVLFAGFEAGWYFGGIHGAGLEAKYYNERLYENRAYRLMQEEKLFPVLMLRYGF